MKVYGQCKKIDSLWLVSMFDWAPPCSWTTQTDKTCMHDFKKNVTVFQWVLAGASVNRSTLCFCSLCSFWQKVTEVLECLLRSLQSWRPVCPIILCSGEAHERQQLLLEKQFLITDSFADYLFPFTPLSWTLWYFRYKYYTDEDIKVPWLINWEKTQSYSPLPRTSFFRLFSPWGVSTIRKQF